jgi:filamentous hemagglutinin family protein
MINNNYNAISFMRETKVSKVGSKVTLTTFLFYQVISVAPVFASPTGGTVVGGEGSIDYQGANTTINQSTDRMAIDWQTFNVGENESVQFIQPSRDSVSLNRILDQNPSQIFGRIDANGNVMLINARGIIFGRSASINVGGLVASSLDVNPAEFINNDSFSAKAVDGTDGVVINQGLINAATGGSVSLINKSVENQGIIVANLG